jgi:zinc/manganese transport system substrate-binding protein
MLAACAATPANTGRGADRLSVVATTTQVGSVAREVGGDDIDLTVLLEPGVEAHDFELTPAHGAALEGADLVLISGAGLEDWLRDSLETIGVANRVRDLSEGIELRRAEAGGAGDPEATGGADGADGAQGDVDPHYWLAAPNAIRMVENARDVLAAADPSRAAAYEERAGVLAERLEAADAEVTRLIGEVPEADRKIVTDHDALGYFLDAYGLEFVGSVLPSLDVSSEPSARDIERLVAELRATSAPAIFTESAVNPRLAEAVADEAGARLVQEPLYADSLGPEGSGAETLDGMLLHNARVIRDGLLGD